VGHGEARGARGHREPAGAARGVGRGEHERGVGRRAQHAGDGAADPQPAVRLADRDEVAGVEGDGRAGGAVGEGGHEARGRRRVGVPGEEVRGEHGREQRSRCQDGGGRLERGRGVGDRPGAAEVLRQPGGDEAEGGRLLVPAVEIVVLRGPDLAGADDVRELRPVCPLPHRPLECHLLTGDGDSHAHPLATVSVGGL
jgi:hypothetical protein